MCSKLLSTLVAAAFAATVSSQVTLNDRASNALALYGRINQRAVTPAGFPANAGLWACGPTSLANSLAYLERRHPNYYRRSLVPDLNRNGVLEDVEIKAVAEDLCQANYMDLSVPMNAGNRCDGTLPYTGDVHGRGDNNAPGGWQGGVTYPRFVFGKDCWFRRVGVPRTIIRGELREAWPQAAPAKPAWIRDGVRLDARKIFDELRAGADVEIGFRWEPGGGGGHCVTVRGYDFKNGDLNNNGRLDPGETAVLEIIDPWDPNGCNLATAPAINNAVLGMDNMGELNIAYAGGAAGMAGGGVLRLWCSERPPCVNPAAIIRHCVGKAGLFGIPSWGPNPLVIGTTVDLRIENGLPGSSPIIFIGTGRVCVPVVPYGTLAVSPIITSFFSAPFNAGRVSSLQLSVPDNHDLCGFELDMQAWFLDPAAAGFPLAHTDGAAFVLGH